MKRSAILAAAAVILLGQPEALWSQAAPPAARAIDDQARDIRAAGIENAVARNSLVKCADLPRLTTLVQEALDLLNRARTVQDLSFKTPGSTYELALRVAEETGRNYSRAAEQLLDLEKKCAQPPAGDVGAVQSATPSPAPEQFFMPDEKGDPLAGVTYLYRWAQIRLGAHTQAAANCDIAEMDKQRGLLRVLVAGAERFQARAQTAHRRGRLTDDQLQAVKQYVEAIRATQSAALAQAPMNCPGEAQPPQPPAPPLEQQHPDKPEQQQQQEVPAPPGYGVRFTAPDEQSRRFLARINYWRSDAGMTALSWDRELAFSAEARGPELEVTGRRHRTRTGPRKVGENLLQSLPGQRSIEQMIDVWGNEKRYFVPGTFPSISTTRDWSAAGHYSQMIWGGSRWVGCGTHVGGGWEYTVCHFYPVGNKDGIIVFAPPPGDVGPFIPPK